GGSHVLTAADDKTVKLWNIGNGVADRSFDGAEGPAIAVAISKNGVLAAVGGADKTVRVYTFADGKPLSQVKVPSTVTRLGFSPNSQVLAVACDDKSVLTFNVVFNPGQPPPAEFGKPMQSYAHAAGVTDLAFNLDNSAVISSSLDKSIKTWKIASDNP